MSGLTEGRDTVSSGGAVPEVFSFGVSSATTCYAGGLAVLNGGYAEPGTEATGLICAGRFEQTVTNAGADGAENVKVRPGAYWWANSSSGDAITAAHRGRVCYIAYDNQVALTSNTGARSPAGLVLQVDSTKGVLVYSSPLLSACLEDASFADGIAVDTISEFTSATGVTIDGVLLKDSTVKTDTIIEKTSATGVTADGLLIKDGGLPVLMPGITSLQVVTGTLINGVCEITVGAGQTVTAATKAIAMPSAVVTGSTNFGCLAHLIASNVVGGSGVGKVTIEALTNAGVLDADAAGLFAVLLIN